VYTDDSDLVAVLMHAGYYAANTAANPPQVGRGRFPGGGRGAWARARRAGSSPAAAALPPCLGRGAAAARAAVESCSPAPSPLPQVASFHAVLELLPPRAAYPSSLRNSVRSRAWMAPVEGCSFRVRAAAGGLGRGRAGSQAARAGWAAA
jgi:hypothetical protein